MSLGQPDLEGCSLQGQHQNLVLQRLSEPQLRVEGPQLWASVLTPSLDPAAVPGSVGEGPQPILLADDGPATPSNARLETEPRSARWRELRSPERADRGAD